MNTFFSDCQFIEIGCKLYLDISFENLVPNGSYSDGNKCYAVLNGIVEFISNCPEQVGPTPTPTATPVQPTPTATPVQPTPTATPTPTMAPIPLKINWELSEDRFTTPSDYVDANIRIFVNDIQVMEEYGNNLGVIDVFSGDSIRVQYFYISSLGTSLFVSNPKLELSIDGSVTVKNITIDQDATYNHVFVITQDTSIIVTGYGDIINSSLPIPTQTPTEGVIINWYHSSLNSNLIESHKSVMKIEYYDANSIRNRPVIFIDETPIGYQSYTQAGTLNVKQGTDVIVTIQNFGTCPVITNLELSPTNPVIELTNPNNVTGGTYTNIQLGIPYEISAFTQLQQNCNEGGVIV